MSVLIYSLMNLPIQGTSMYLATKSCAGSLYRSRFTSVHRSKLESDKGKCACGRRMKEATVFTYRSHTDRFLFHRCECCSEWTDHLTYIEQTDPVTSDEL